MTDPESWYLILLALGAGFFFLIKGADWLVESSSQVAQRLGISSLVVGLTIVALGTSAPEIVVSMLAALDGEAALSFGTILGSNVANIGLVLGACAVILPQVLESRLKLREVFWLFAALGLFWFIVSDYRMSRQEGALLIGAFVLYNLHVLFTGKARPADEQKIEIYKRPMAWTLLGIVSIAGGAKLVVLGAIWGAQRLDISPGVVGLTLVAVGTSLPELAAGLTGALRGERDISIGNVIGSNVLNILAAIGLVAVISPFGTGSSSALAGESAQDGLMRLTFQRTLDEDLYFVLGFSIAAVCLPYLGGPRGGRLKGILLLAAYSYFSYWLYQTRGLEI